MSKVVVIVPNWNGADDLGKCLDSLLAQTYKAHIIVVDNGSTDGSLDLLSKYPSVELIKHSKNLGYTGGINPGFKRAIELGLDYVAPFNNDAVADKDWLEYLVQALDRDPKIGIVTSKILTQDGTRIDSTGDYYTIWGLPYPRGRDETDINKYDDQVEIFGASGGASLFRVKMLEQIGLYDQAYFAYYEDIDLSFRAQLAGWKVQLAPQSIAYHQIGVTSGKIKGFTTYQTCKNLPLLFWRNVPGIYLWLVFPRLFIVYNSFYLRAISRGQFWPATKGMFASAIRFPVILAQRHKIQHNRKVPAKYIWENMVHDLPPNARALRKLFGKPV